MTPEERGQSQILVYQYLPSRYGMNPDDLRKADAIEIVIGQGAKPGGGGMLLGQKISDRVAEMRTLPKGIDQRSACRHPDWTGADDLEIKIDELREITDWEKPIYHQGRRRAALLRRRARGEGRRRCRRARRHAGRHGGDAGSVHRARRHADARLHPPGRRRRCRTSACTARCSSSSRAAFATAPMSPRRWRSVPTRCRSARRRWWRSVTTTRSWEAEYQKLGTTAGAYDDWHEGKDPAGITTQTSELTRRLDPVLAGRRLANYLKVMTLEAQTIARACGKNHLHNLEPEDLAALTIEAAAMARVPLAGTKWIPGAGGF